MVTFDDGVITAYSVASCLEYIFGFIHRKIVMAMVTSLGRSGGTFKEWWWLRVSNKS